MAQVGRLGDTTTRGKQIIQGASTVFVNNKPLAFIGSKISDLSTVITGNPTVFVEGKPIAKITSATTKAGSVVTGSTNVSCG